MQTPMPRLALSLLFLSPAECAISRAGVIRAAAAAAFPFAGIDVYSKLPPLGWNKDDFPRLSGLDAKAETEIVLVIPGAGGPDANTRRIVESMKSRSNRVAIYEYDWSAFVGGQLKAPYNAMRVGDFLADELRGSRCKSLHVVGISVGGFVADRLTARLAAREDAPRQLKMTLLDPFTARGIPGLLRPSTAYGVTRFGSALPDGATTNVFNSDDPVPSTNLPLRHAINFDITNAAERRSFTPLPGDSLHSWPAAWFGKNPTGIERRMKGASQGLTRGSVTIIE